MFEIVTVIAGLVLAAIAAWQGIRANKLARRFAELQGVSRKPSLEIALFRASGLVREFDITLPFDGKTGFVVPIPISIHNTGDAAAKDVEIYLRLPHDLVRDDIGGHRLKRPAFKIGSVVKVSKSERLITYAASVKNIHAAQRMVIDMQIPIASETTMKVTGSAAALDGTIDYECVVVFGYTIDVLVSAENLLPSSAQFTVQVQSGGHEQLRKIYDARNQRTAEQKRAVPRRRDPWYRRWKTRSKTAETRLISVVVPEDFEYEQHGEYRFARPRSYVRYPGVSVDGFAAFAAFGTLVGAPAGVGRPAKHEFTRLS